MVFSEGKKMIHWQFVNDDDDDESMSNVKRPKKKQWEYYYYIIIISKKKTWVKLTAKKICSKRSKIFSTLNFNLQFHFFQSFFTMTILLHRATKTAENEILKRWQKYNHHHHDYKIHWYRSSFFFANKICNYIKQEHCVKE